MQPPGWWRREGRDLVLYVKVQPNAREDAIAGVRDDALVVRVAAPPTEGRANRRLGEFLARAFGVPKSGVTLERGAGGRRKCLRIREPARWPAELPHDPPQQSLPTGK